MLATYPPDDFREDNLACRLSRRRTFIVNERESPVFLDNAQNYITSEVSRRILEPRLAGVFPISDGETERHDRRKMALSFDPAALSVMRRS
jgi:hypothetical protein